MSAGNLLLSESGYPHTGEPAQHSSIDALQYKIDNLMLEYCPDEMTKEQMANWEKHQIPSTNSDIGIAISGISQQQAQSTMLRKPTIITPDERDMLKNATCFANDGTERDWSQVEPEFDAMNPDQERLAIEFCEEIAGKKGDKPLLPDPVRLLEMAQALYMAEKSCIDPQQPAQPSCEPFNPDWSLLEATQQSLRDHMAMLHELQAENAQLKETNKSMSQTLRFVERWANHHAVKPTMTSAEALSCIQHYPPILDITRGHEDGKVPLTPNPFAERELLKEREQWIHDNSKTVGGGHGFTVTFFVPVDHEDIFCGISEAIKLEQK